MYLTWYQKSCRCNKLKDWGQQDCPGWKHDYQWMECGGGTQKTGVSQSTPRCFTVTEICLPTGETSQLEQTCFYPDWKVHQSELAWEPVNLPAQPRPAPARAREESLSPTCKHHSQPGARIPMRPRMPPESPGWGVFTGCEAPRLSCTQAVPAAPVSDLIMGSGDPVWPRVTRGPRTPRKPCTASRRAFRYIRNVVTIWFSQEEGRGSPGGRDLPKSQRWFIPTCS